MKKKWTEYLEAVKAFLSRMGRTSMDDRSTKGSMR